MRIHERRIQKTNVDCCTMGKAHKFQKTPPLVLSSFREFETPFRFVLDFKVCIDRVRGHGLGNKQIVRVILQLLSLFLLILS